MMSEKKCWICNSIAEQHFQEYVYYYKCPRCGIYSVNFETYEDYRPSYEPNVIANYSGWIRDNQEIRIDSSVFKILENLSPLPVLEKMDRMLIWISKQIRQLGQLIEVQLDNANLQAICWSFGEKEIRSLVGFLQDVKRIKQHSEKAKCIIVRMELDGIKHVESLSVSMKSNMAFCAMSFADALTPVWQDEILPGINDAGYDAVRIDSEQFNAGIVDEIKAKIRQAKFIIADLTLHRNGVYFEAGFASGLGREVILTCRKGDFDDAHFDVKHMNVIIWENEKPGELKRRITARIEGTIGRGSRITK
jgi:hypothetical protein